MSIRLSQNWRKAEDREKKLEALLPAYSISGSYTQLDQDKIRGFIVLFHAELEDYFEKRLEEIKNYFQGLTSKATLKKHELDAINYAYQCIALSLFNGPFALTPSNSHKITVIIKYCAKAIDKNNGIKESNLMKLIYPFNINFINLGTWVSQLNDYGRLRGDIAHTSSVPSTTVILDPRDQKNKALDLLNGLKEFDRSVSKLIR